MGGPAHTAHMPGREGGGMENRRPTAAPGTFVILPAAFPALFVAIARFFLDKQGWEA